VWVNAGSSYCDLHYEERFWKRERERERGGEMRLKGKKRGEEQGLRWNRTGTKKKKGNKKKSKSKKKIETCVE
jgi:hypothetical protein